jgi:hypothetical protein
MQPMFEGMFAANTAALRSLLDTEMAERAAADGAEPALPVPSPDGVLSALAASTAA